MIGLGPSVVGPSTRALAAQEADQWATPIVAQIFTNNEPLLGSRPFNNFVPFDELDHLSLPDVYSFEM